MQKKKKTNSFYCRLISILGIVSCLRWCILVLRVPNVIRFHYLCLFFFFLSPCSYPYPNSIEMQFGPNVKDICRLVRGIWIDTIHFPSCCLFRGSITKYSETQERQKLEYFQIGAQFSYCSSLVHFFMWLSHGISISVTDVKSAHIFSPYIRVYWFHQSLMHVYPSQRISFQPSNSTSSKYFSACQWHNKIEYSRSALKKFGQSRGLFRPPTSPPRLSFPILVKPIRPHTKWTCSRLVWTQKEYFLII